MVVGVYKDWLWVIQGQPCKSNFHFHNAFSLWAYVSMKSIYFITVHNKFILLINPLTSCNYIFLVSVHYDVEIECAVIDMMQLYNLHKSTTTEIVYSCT